MTGSWPVRTGYGRVWPVLTRYGRLLAGGYGRVLAGIVGSARYASTLLIILSAKRVEGSFKDVRPKVSSMMASIDEDVEKSSLTDQDDVGSGVSRSRQNKSRNFLCVEAVYATLGLIFVTVKQGLTSTEGAMQNERRKDPSKACGVDFVRLVMLKKNGIKSEAGRGVDAVSEERCVQKIHMISWRKGELPFETTGVTGHDEHRLNNHGAWSSNQVALDVMWPGRGR
ncbi:hypothetical protein Tco_0213965 [Tanacetum coccineum]